MLGRTIIALVCSPYYGSLVALATIPIMIVGTVALGLLSIASLILPLVIAVLSFVVQAAIYAQSARYAAAITGLMSIIHQREYFQAVGRSLMITVITGVVSALVIVAFFLVYLQFGGAEQFWWMDSEKLLPAVEIAMDSPAAAEQIFSFENMKIGSLIFIVEAFSMFFITLIALIVLPRATGLGEGYDRTYTIGLILTRLFVAFPFCAAMTGLVTGLLVFVLQQILNLVADGVEATTMLRYFIELTLFTGMIFAFEAHLLRTGREQAEEEIEWARETVETTGHSDIRALREAWSERH